MKNYKKVLFVSMAIVIISVICLNWYNSPEINWTYLKYNNNLYVLNTPETLEKSGVVNLKKVGKVDKEILRFFTPQSNRVSNGLPKGTEIFTIDNISESSELIIKFKGNYYTLVNTNADGWGNGIMVKLD